jgi:hypothetical protein
MMRHERLAVYKIFADIVSPPANKKWPPVFCPGELSASKLHGAKVPSQRTGEDAMTLVRRRFLRLAAAAVAAPATTGIVLAQAPQGGPKLTQILRHDLQAQDQKVQETVVNVLEMAPGVGLPGTCIRRHRKSCLLSKEV